MDRNRSWSCPQEVGGDIGERPFRDVKPTAVNSGRTGQQRQALGREWLRANEKAPPAATDGAWMRAPNTGEPDNISAGWNKKTSGLGRSVTGGVSFLPPKRSGSLTTRN